MMEGFIDHLAVIAIRGSDALVFSHSQLANDVKALPNGHWHWNSLLQIQGRVLALMLLARLTDDEILLVLPGELRADVASTLRRYVLRSKVRIEPDDARQVHGSLLDPGCSASGPVASGNALCLEGDRVELALAGCTTRTLSIIKADASSKASIDEAWRRADIADGIPWIRTATSGEFIPQALGLSRLSAYSVSKGCYPGQEIVARTHFLGRNKRVLKRFVGEGYAPAPGDRLHGESEGSNNPVAIVIDAVPVGARFEGLAVTRDAEVAVASWHGPLGSVPITLSDA